MMSSIKLLFFVVLILVAVASAISPIPNIGYIASGYHIFYGNPHSSSGFDAGFRSGNPMFTLTYENHKTTPDGLWLIPDHTSVPGTDGQCNLQSDGFIVGSIQDYISDLSVDCIYNATSAAGTAFSASSDFQQVNNDLANGNVYVSVKGACEAFKVYINTDVHPDLSSNFVSAASRLPEHFNLTDDMSAFWTFFNTYGTHYLTLTTFGARWGFLFESTPAQWITLQTTGLDIGEAASFAGLQIVGVSNIPPIQQQEAEEFVEYTSGYVSFGLGFAPPSNGNISSWQQTTLTSTELIPINYQLIPLNYAFSTAWGTNTALHERQVAVAAALQYYCSVYLTTVTPVSC
jgi:hypothetical protein